MRTDEPPFMDDQPVFDWSEFTGEPARSWRTEPAPKFTVGEAARAGIIGAGLFIFGALFLVLAFCM